MFSAAMLAFTMVGAWPISIFAALAHGVIAVGQLMACLGHLWRSGTDWSVTELLSLHALWINLLFGGLHILNVSRNADRFKDGPVQEGDG
jgi:hypothetical protein